MLAPGGSEQFSASFLFRTVLGPINFIVMIWTPPPPQTVLVIINYLGILGPYSRAHSLISACLQGSVNVDASLANSCC